MSIERIQRDINKIDDQLERLTDEMKRLAEKYRNADAEGKQKLVPEMKKKSEEKRELTDEKRELHAELSAEVEHAGVDAELEMAEINESRIKEKIHRVVELMTRKHLREFGSKNKKDKKSKMSEYDSTFSITAIEEITDDLLLGTEMLIDEYYGDISVHEFKEKWNKLSIDFDNKIKSIAGKQIKNKN